jgi:hypothetical protein
MTDYGSDTYNALIKVVKIRFAKELQDSGIQLQGFYAMKNLASRKEFYLLEVNNIQIRFIDEKGFLLFFPNFLKKNIDELTKRYKYLFNRPIDEISDEVGIEYEYKQIDYFIFKQKQLFKKLIEYKQNKYQ